MEEEMEKNGITLDAVVENNAHFKDKKGKT